MADLNVKITTAADLAGTDAAKAGLKGVAQEADAVAASGKGTTASLDGLAGGLAKIPQLAVAIGLAAGVKEAISAYAQAENQVMALTAALVNQGQASDANREHLVALADQLQATTGIADDEWREAIIRLINTGKAHVDQMDTHTGAVKRLAGLTGMDAVQAATLYGRALQGNFEMLGRYGIQIDATLSREQKLLALQDALARGAGLLEARHEGLGGQMQSLKNASGDLLEGFGRLLNSGGGLTKITELFALSLGDLAAMLPGATDGMKSLGDETAATKSAVGSLAETTADLTKRLEESEARSRGAVEAQNALRNATIENQIAQAELAAMTGDLSRGQADQRIAELEALKNTAPSDAEALRLRQQIAAVDAEIAANRAAAERAVAPLRPSAEEVAKVRETGLFRESQIRDFATQVKAIPPELLEQMGVLQQRRAVFEPQLAVAEQREQATAAQALVRKGRAEEAQEKQKSEGVAGVTKLLEPGAREQETQARRDAERQAREAQRLAEGTSRLRETAAAALGETLSAVERLQRDMENMKARVANLRTH